MNDDIDNLIRDMQNQFTHMRQDYQRELGNIEKAFDDERDQITEYNNAEIEALFKEHTDQETQAALKRATQEEENARQLEDVRNLDANNQADQKIKLEREMQILEKCMEDMKAVYKLNEEKLGFNFRVLTEKIRVNKNTKKSNGDKLRNY
jgi:dynein regulatry complex protein 1